MKEGRIEAQSTGRREVFHVLPRLRPRIRTLEEQTMGTISRRYRIARTNQPPI